jgi:hypothetical protein
MPLGFARSGTHLHPGSMPALAHPGLGLHDDQSSSPEDSEATSPGLLQR